MAGYAISQFILSESYVNSQLGLGTGVRPHFDISSAASLFLRLFVANLFVYTVLISGFWTFGVLSVVTLIYNGFRLGLLFAIATNEIGIAAVGIALLPHGAVEIPALVLGGAIGLCGWGVGNQALREGQPQFSKELHRLAPTILLGITMIAVAALIEAVVTPQLISRSYSFIL